jgi:hypothetical protein
LLAGEWGFFWNQYLQPAEARSDAPAYLILPGVWNLLDYPGASLTVLGHASLRLRLSLQPDSRYVLAVPTLTNRVRIWADETALLVDDLEAPRSVHLEATQSRRLRFHSGDGQVELLIHVVNDRHRAGGIWEPLQLTTEAHEPDLESWSRIRDILGAFALALTGVLILWMGVRERRGALAFLAIFAACMSVRAGTVNDRLLFATLAIQDWELQQLFEHLSLFASLPFFALYLGYRFPTYFSPLLHWLTTAIMGSLILLVMITPPSVYSHTITIIKAVAIGYAYLLLGALLEQVRQQHRPALILLGGSLVFILAVVNDVLYTSNLIDTTNLTHLGALAFLLVAVFYRDELARPEWLIERIRLLPAEVPAAAANEAISGKPEPNVEPATPMVPVEPPHPLQMIYEACREKADEATLRELTAQALAHAVDEWQRLTGRGKIDLAEQSGLWRVTNDAGTLKTRTLDKYMKASGLPRNARYRTVAQTLRFVAATEQASAQEREWLERVALLLEKVS